MVVIWPLLESIKRSDSGVVEVSDSCSADERSSEVDMYCSGGVVRVCISEYMGYREAFSVVEGEREFQTEESEHGRIRYMGNTSFINTSCINLDNSSLCAAFEAMGQTGKAGERFSQMTV